MELERVDCGAERLEEQESEAVVALTEMLVEDHLDVDRSENLRSSVSDEGLEVKDLSVEVGSVGERGSGDVDDVGSKEMDSMNGKRLVEEENMDVEKSEGVNSKGVDSVGSALVESGRPMSLIDAKTPCENDMDVDSEGVNSKGVDSVGPALVKSGKAVSSIDAKTPRENDMAVNSDENTMGCQEKRIVGSDVAKLVDGETLAEKNMVVDSVDNSIDSVAKRVGENNVGGNSVGLCKEGVGSMKRVAENSIDEGLGLPRKKAKVDRSRDMKSVAEMVLVLSAMSSMRGGRSPTTIEKEIMAEAREKMVGLCEELAPKDIVPRDAVRTVIEDLGINKSRDQRLGFRPPMMSIKEKLQLSKRKMEESKKFVVQSGLFSSQIPQGGIGAKNENPAAYVHGTQRFPDRPSQIAALAGGSKTSSSLNQANEAQSANVSRGPISSPLTRDASSLPLTRTETMHFRLDGKSNVSTYGSQVQANSSGDHLLGKTPTSAPHHQLGAVARVGLANKGPDHKVEGTPVIGASQVASPDTRYRSSNHSLTQTAYVNPQAVQQPSQGLNAMHNEIGKNVQMFLYPKPLEHPSWTPPSTDYMNKSLTCQACRSAIIDVESLLVCDACEKGSHIRCLPASNQKGIPKSEWHCPNCLQQSNGKPLPPKYGRVTRNSSAPKVSSNVAAFQASVEKKVQNSDQKINHQKVTANGHPVSLHPAQTGRAGNIHVAAASDSHISSAREVQAANSLGSKVKTAVGPVPQNTLLKDMAGLAHVLPSAQPNGRSNQQFQSHNCLPKREPAETSLDKLSEAGIATCHGSQPHCSSQDVRALRPRVSQVSSEQYHNVQISDLREPSDVRKDGHDAAQTVSVGNIGVGNGARDCLKSSLDGLHSVDWVGDILQVVDEKAFYGSCHINGMMYKLQDYALFHSNNGNLRPSKLQAMWEDTKTGSKWALVNSCYFPADLPEVVGRPCSPEKNEVYESNHDSTVRAGLVQGPCKVLPPNKFKEESEGRTLSDDITEPLFLCKWFYDESKGLFRPVTD